MLYDRVGELRGQVSSPRPNPRASALQEGVRLIVGERPVPAFLPGKLAPHPAELRLLRRIRSNQPRDGPAVPLDQHLLALFEQIEEPRKLCFRLVNADGHQARF